MMNKLGVLMLDTKFERIVGDIGNPQSFPMPVVYKTVKGATVSRIVKEGDKRLIRPFIDAAKELESQGADAITTSCGFLALFQKDIASGTKVPFYSSSLMQLPLVFRMFGGPVGILTARKASLSMDHLAAVGAEKVPSVIYGMDDMPSFTSAIVEETHPLDKEKIEAEMVHLAKQLVADHPEIKAIVLECTNMPPYKESIRKAVSLPIFDIFTLTEFVFSSLKQ